MGNSYNIKNSKFPVRNSIEQNNKKLQKSVVKLQTFFRGYFTRKKFRNICEKEMDLEHVENYQFQNGAIYTGIALLYHRSIEKWQ